MIRNAKLVRWLAPVCLLILLFILILAMNFTTSASTPNLHTVATAVSAVNQTATAQAASQKPPSRSTPIRPTPKPTNP